MSHTCNVTEDTIAHEDPVDPKRDRHNTLRMVYADQRLMYLADVGVLQDGRLLINYGTTSDLTGYDESVLMCRKDFNLIDVIPCFATYELGEWMSMHHEFTSRKYKVAGLKGGRCFAVASTDYDMLKMLIKVQAKLLVQEERHRAMDFLSERMDLVNTAIHQMRGSLSSDPSSETVRPIYLAGEYVYEMGKILRDLVIMCKPAKGTDDELSE